MIGTNILIRLVPPSSAQRSPCGALLGTPPLQPPLHTAAASRLGPAACGRRKTNTNTDRNKKESIQKLHQKCEGPTLLLPAVWGAPNSRQRATSHPPGLVALPSPHPAGGVPTRPAGRQVQPHLERREGGACRQTAGKRWRTRMARPRGATRARAPSPATSSPTPRAWLSNSRTHSRHT